MFVTYKPEDGDEQRWDFDPRRVRASKAEMIEKRAGENWDVWLASLQSGNMRARRVLLWHLMTVDHPTIRWEDVPDFYAEELSVEHSVSELTDIRDRVTKASAKIPSDQYEQILTALDGEITDAMEREQVTETVGKARSKNAD